MICYFINHYASVCTTDQMRHRAGVENPRLDRITLPQTLSQQVSFALRIALARLIQGLFLGCIRPSCIPHPRRLQRRGTTEVNGYYACRYRTTPVSRCATFMGKCNPTLNNTR